MSRLIEDVERMIDLAHSVKELHIGPLEHEPLGPLLLALQQARLGVEVCNVAQGKVMLRIWAQECHLD